MIEKIDASLATCVQALTDQEAQALCWVEIRYFLEGGFTNPKVGLCVAPTVSSASDLPADQPIGVNVEPLLITDDGKPLEGVHVGSPQNKLLRFAEEAGVASILCHLWQQELVARGQTLADAPHGHGVEPKVELFRKSGMKEEV